MNEMLERDKRIAERIGYDLSERPTSEQRKKNNERVQEITSIIKLKKEKLEKEIQLLKTKYDNDTQDLVEEKQFLLRGRI